MTNRQKAYQKGYTAAKFDLQWNDCPYTTEDLIEAWEQGFNDCNGNFPCDPSQV